MEKMMMRNGTIIDVQNGDSFIGSIELEGSRIKRIYRQDDVLPEGLKTVDMEGKYIIPGLIDMHCHITENFAAHFVASGVTTVRNTAGNVLLLNKLMEQPDDAPVPRVYASDRMIDGTPGQWGPNSYGNFVTDDPEEARKEVRRQVEVGAKFIKLYGWIKKDVMKAAADEAKKFGLELSIDLINSKDVTIVDAAEAGVTWIEHVSGAAQEMYKGWSPMVDQSEWKHINWEEPDQEKVEEICQKLLNYDVKLCPTMVLFDQAMRFPNIWAPKNKVIESIENKKTPTEYWKSHEKLIDHIKESNAVISNLTKAIAKTYYRMGGTVVAGTDTPALLYTYPGMALHRELEIFVELGFTELEALQTATVKAARAIHLEDIGVIEEGNIADLVILDENPLEDIKHTQTIHSIIKGGRVYSQEELLATVPSEEEVQKSIDAFITEWEAIGV